MKFDIHLVSYRLRLVLDFELRVCIAVRLMA